MTTTSTPRTRLIFAALAAATTLGLFSAVVSFAETQRSVLIAKNQRVQKLAAAPIEVALASRPVAGDGR